MFPRRFAAWLRLGFGVAVLAGCGDESGSEDDGGASGRAGTAGSGVAGNSGASGTGGKAGAAGSGTGGATSGSPGQGGAGLAGAAAGGSAGAGGGSVVGPRFIGRFTSDHRFAWSGATIVLHFTGTAVSVTLTDTGD